MITCSWKICRGRSWITIGQKLRNNNSVASDKWLTIWNKRTTPFVQRSIYPRGGLFEISWSGQYFFPLNWMHRHFYFVKFLFFNSRLRNLFLSLFDLAFCSNWTTVFLAFLSFMRVFVMTSFARFTWIIKSTFDATNKSFLVFLYHGKSINNN